MSTNPSMPAPPASPTDTSREGGLTVPGRYRLQQVFTVALTVLFVDLVGLLLLPYSLHRNTLSQWCEIPRLAFLAQSIAAANLLGLMVAIAADRMNRSAWWYLSAHIGAWLALPLAAAGWVDPLGPDEARFGTPLFARTLVGAACAIGGTFALLMVRRPRDRFRTDALGSALARAWHAVGNIWVGIVIMVILTVMLIFGTLCEAEFGGRTAKHLYYTSAPFFALAVAFAFSLASATLRKFPWRFDQSGWLGVHIALLIIVVGAFMTFWGKKEGMLTIRETETANAYKLSTESLFVVRDAKTSEIVWREIVTFSKDASELRPEEKHTVRNAEGERLFDVTVTEWLPDHDRRSRLVEGGPEVAERAAVTGSVVPLRGDPRRFWLVAGGQRRAQEFREYDLRLLLIDSLLSPAMDACLRGGQHAGDQRGELVVRDAQGAALGQLALTRGKGQEQFLEEMDQKAEIPGRGVTVAVKRYVNADPQSLVGGGEPRRPDGGFFPLLQVEITSSRGSELRWVAALHPSVEKALNTTAPLHDDLSLEFHYRPRQPMDQGDLFFYRVANGAGTPTWRWVYEGDTLLTGRQAGEVAPGTSWRIEGLPVRIAIERLLRRPRVDVAMLPREKRPRFEAAHLEFNEGVSILRQELRGMMRDQASLPPPRGWMLKSHAGSYGTQGSLFWLDTDADGVADYTLGWEARSLPLDFQLELLEFRRDFYPGSDTPRTFEAYVVLNHPEKRFSSEEAGDYVKIDMNRPLVLDGLRLYQASFNGEAQTTLQVNTDPGLVTTYAGAILLALALVVVFFQKSLLRVLGRMLRQKGASVARSFGVVALVYGACALGAAPGLLVLAFMPAGAVMLFGVLLVLVGITVECHLATKVVKPALERRLGARPAGA